jgi:sulfatase maturation enzyme AslB (radical SAM superfamily)
MSLDAVRPLVAEADRIGVKEIYLTGGEPFLNPEILPILEECLAVAPVGVLTNGVLLKPEVANRLAELARWSEYTLDVRISIDGWDAETNDPIRGAGTFERILEGIGNLAAAGLNPVITVTEAFPEAATRSGRTRFLSWLLSIGLTQPRLKVLPLLRIGAEETRVRGYQSCETLEGVTLTEEETAALQCSSCRMVTSKGVYVCPILVEQEDARMGATLEETLRPFVLSHASCWTCHKTGLSCRT